MYIGFSNGLLQHFGRKGQFIAKLQSIKFEVHIMIEDKKMSVAYELKPYAMVRAVWRGPEGPRPIGPRFRGGPQRSIKKNKIESEISEILMEHKSLRKKYCFKV